MGSDTDVAVEGKEDNHLLKGKVFISQNHFR